MKRRVLTSMMACTLAFAAGGCIVIGNGGWSLGWTTHWTEEVTEELQLDPAGLATIDAQTHNGAILFAGQAPGATEAHVTVTKKGGGRSPGDAADALEAIEVFSKRSADGTVRLGWKWRNGIKRRGWNGHVGFDITGPGGVRIIGETHNGPIEIREAGDVRAKTHNGRIEIANANGDVHAVTHNGPVGVDSVGGKLHAETHNGWVHVGYTGGDVTLITHNGEVVADLQDCTAIDGDITTHNGSIELVVGERTSADLQCKTHNGGIKCNVPLSNTEITRRKLSGTIGAGDGRLDVTTHNGGIRVKKGAG